MADSLDTRLAELEEGFRDLVAGVLALAKDLRDENASLRARLDERRQMTTAEGPAPAVSRDGAAPAVNADAPPARRVRYPATVRTCGICKQSFVGTGERMFCDTCGRIRKRGGLKSGALAARAAACRTDVLDEAAGEEVA
jgi:hypothetical protein